ncbi:MAG: serine hydrolase [Lachnospiraceae bacterium]|nr:serine hydrolase [Lachnospiraceae bacterium]
MNFESLEKRALHLGILGIKVSQDNVLIGEKLWDDEMRRNLYSASKSFTSCAVGFAVQEGLLSLDEKLTDAFSGDMPAVISDNLAKATVRDLLTMHLGQEGAHLMGEQRPFYDEDDWVKLSFEIPLKYEPGTHFQYSNVGPYLAGVLVQRRCGCNLVSYLTPRLFNHLGIKCPTWEVDPLGYTFGAGGLMLTLSELHKFGLFYLNKGKWNGKQLLSPEWIEESTRQYAEAPYAYLFWRGEHNSYRAVGRYDQTSMIFPDTNTVITFVSECRDSESLTKAVIEEVYEKL